MTGGDFYPSRPVRYVVPFGSGPTEVQAHWIAERLGAALGPELPTVAEAGVAGFDSYNWNGVAAPARTVPQVVDKLNNNINKLMNSTEAREWFGAKGYDIAGGTPQAFGAFMRAEREKWAKAAKLAGLSAVTR